MFKARYNKFKRITGFFGDEVLKLFAISIFVGLFWFLIESSFIYVLQGFLRSVNLIEEKNTFLPSFYPKSVVGSLGCLLAFGLFRALASGMKQYYLATTNQAFIRDQRARVLEHSLSQAIGVSSHNAINLFNERIPQSAGVIVCISSFIHSLISGVLFFFLGMIIAPVELVLGVGLLLLLFFPFNMINKRISELGESIVAESRKLSKILVLGLRNHFLLKIYDITVVEIEKGKNAVNSYEQYFKKFLLISSLKSSFPQFAGAIVLTIICFISINYLETPGIKLVSLIYIFMRLAQTMSEGSATISSFRFNLPSLTELYHWHLATSDFFKEIIVSKQNDSMLNQVKIDSGNLIIKIENIFFSYNGGKELFNGVSLELNKGDVLLIKGKSGCGKSTLLSLILGLLEPTQGKILICDKDIASVRKSLAASTAYVGPDPFIVEGTIRDNLLYGCVSTDITDEDMWQVIKLAQLNELVLSDSLGLNRKLKEVTELSTGQKQRLAIARALLRKPKLLVFDEATANLDHNTEAEIARVIQTISKDVTSIIISHKNSFDSLATEVINLEKS